MITSHDRPRLREDLVAEAIEDRGVRFIDVIDPDNGNAYRFYDVEYSLACAMDGERDIPGLVRWAQEELGIAPSPKELQTVIATLGDLGYLDAAAAPAVAADPGLAPGVRAGAAAPASGIEVELGRFQAPEPVAARSEPAAELELGVAGGTARVLEIEDDVPEVALGPSGANAAPSLPVPSAAASSKPALPTPTPASTVAAALPRPRTNTPHGEGPPSARPPQPSRGSEPSVRAAAPAARTSEPKIRPSEPAVRAPASEPSLNLDLQIRPDDVKEAVRASREMRSVDVPAELMQALEAAEQAPVTPPAASPPKSVPLPSAAPPPASVPLPLAARSERIAPIASAPSPSPSVPSSVLDPIAPLSGAPLSMSEPISPSSVPPLVPAPRSATAPTAEARPEPRTKSEPRLEYPRTAEARPALVPAPREPAPPVAATPIPEAPRRSGGMWIVAVLVVAILGVVGFGVWKFVLQKKPVVEQAPVQPTPSTNTPTAPTAPEAVPAEPAAPTVKLSLVKGAPVSVKMPVAGAIQSIIADGTVVTENDEIARLAGGKAIEQNIAAAKGDLEKRYPADITRLKAKVAAAPGDRGAQRELANREARVVQRTKDLEGYQAELAKYVVLAKAAGKVTVVAKPNARLGLDAEIATIESEQYLSGAVDLGKPVAAQAGDAIEVKLKGDGATASAQCTLETVQDTKVSFRCPVSDGFADGTEVTVEAK